MTTSLALFAPLQTPATPQALWILVGVVAVVLFILSLILMLVTRYKRCPSNRVLVIYGWVGKGEPSKCLHGGSYFVKPLIQSYDYLNLDPIQIDVPLKGALSAENIRVNVPSVFTVAIGTTGPIMQNAAIRLLGLSTDEIKNQALEIKELAADYRKIERLPVRLGGARRTE